MNSTSSNSLQSTLPADLGQQDGDLAGFRHATRLTALLAVVSAVMLPLLPSITGHVVSPGQQVAQAVADRVAASGGMLWLDQDEVVSTTSAE